MSKIDDLQTMIRAKQRVYLALVTRFVIGRYGRENIGFMWTIVEPMFLCVGVMLIWSFAKGHDGHGVNIAAFVLTGYIPLTLWRHQTGYAVNCLKNSKFLTIFQNLTIFDAMMSRFLLEFLSVSAAGLTVLTILYSLNLVNLPYDWAAFIIGWLMMGALGTGMGILIAALSTMTELVEKLNPPLQYFILPFSGCFYMADWLPDSVREYALLMPMLHSYEMIRSGFFGPETPTYADPFFGFSSALILAGIGCFFFERIKHHVEA